MGLGFVIIVAVLLWYVYSWRKWYQRDREFHRFAQANHCVDPPAIASSLIRGMIHKWNRLDQHKDLFNDYMNAKFVENGATHAITKGLASEIQTIYTIEPANIRTMLSSNFSEYHRPQTMPKAVGPVMGQGVFTSNGAAWAHSRGLVKSQFSNKRIRDVGQLDIHVQNIFEALGSADEGSGWTRDEEILPIFNRFTLDAATEFMFGTSAASHEVVMSRRKAGVNTSMRPHQKSLLRSIGDLFWDADANESEFGDAFDLCLDYVALRLKLGKLWFLADGIRFRLACRRVQRFADRYIRDAAAHAMRAGRLKSGNYHTRSEKTTDDLDNRRYGLISELVESYPDRVALRNQVMQLLVAGRDTTAATLSWTFILLEANPRILQRLINTIVETFGTEDDPRQEINYDSIRSCMYLQWVISEVLRLYPTGPLNGRMASCDTILPVGGGPSGQDPVAVKAGTIVAYNSYLMHRRKEFWGDDAWTFRPERWEHRRTGWEYIPFHGGPQTCLGQQHALAEMGYVIVRIFQRFDSVKSSTRDTNLQNGIRTILVPKHRVRLQFRRRQPGSTPVEDY